MQCFERYSYETMWEWIIVIVVVKIIVWAAVFLACFFRRHKRNIKMVNVHTESGDSYEVPVESATSKGHGMDLKHNFQELNFLINPETGWASVGGRF